MHNTKSRKKGNKLVVEQAQRQIQTFFDELKNGTRNYQTIASLDEQIAQEYRGRCVRALLQNAHDALEQAPSGDIRQVSFILKTGNNPVLLVGNTGVPFREENFTGLCQLGQSPKDPNQSIGNKGLGFRSVLEVSSSPEIWSKECIKDQISFVFRFDPSVSEQVANAARQLEKIGCDPRSPFDPELPLLDWSNEQLGKYHNHLKDKGLNPSQEAHDFLSPYLIPLAIEGLPLEVDALWQGGHVTVIRLPIDGGSKSLTEEAVRAVREQLKELDARSVLFLSNVERIVIEIDGNQRILERSVNMEVEFPEHLGFRHQHILVGESETDLSNFTTREFHIWSQDLGGDDDPEKAKVISAVVKHLPNRWPEVHQVKLGVAVEEASFADKGRFVIFLPTEMKTGTGTHINAPFYGSLNRQHIEFDDPYNEFLLKEVLNLILDVTFNHLLKSREEWSALAIIDLFASLTNVDGQNWKIMETLINQSDQRGIDLNEIKLILCDQGWCNAENARKMPNIPEDSSIESDQWRSFTRFEIISTALEGRLPAVKKLIEYLDGSFEPTQSEWLETVNNLSKAVRDGEINLSWDEFLNSLLSVLPDELKSEPRKETIDPLSNARILPDQDGCLHSASDDIKLFFQPVQGVDETPEFVEQIPQSIKCRVAFLHPDVNTQQKGRKTPVQKFLDGRFIRSFLRSDLIREVVLPAIPDLPITHDCADAKLCSDVLAWVLQILNEKPSEEILSQLAGLPVACFSGWIRMDEAAFGPGWSDCQGENIWLLAERLPKDKAERLRGSLMLPPEDSRWGVAVGHCKELFRQMGVFNGLRLNEAPEIQFKMQEYRYKLPTTPPSEIPQTSWDEWCHAVHYEAKPDYTTEFQYSLTGINTLSEIYFLDTLDEIGRRVLSNLLLVSITQWPSNWDQVTMEKTSGIPSSKTITSPLKYWLKTQPWLIDGTDNGKPLSYRWLIPTSILRGQEERYRHLYCLSMDLSSRLEKDEVLSTLIELGVNVYPVENNQIGPALLEALANTWSSNKVPSGRFDVFLGQVRHAWRHLDPEKGIPIKFLIRTGKRSFETRTRNELTNVYLPDNRSRTQSLREHQIPILEMHPQDANRLVSEFLSNTNIKLASELTENFVIDGTIWEGVSESLQSIEDSSYASWLPITLLAIAAYGGQNPTGTATKRWNDIINRLRRTQLIFPENIVTQLMDKDKVVAETEPDAEWLSGDFLAIRQDTILQHEKLATAAQKLLDRNNLIVDLRFVLGTLANCETPSHDKIEEALERVEIDTQEFSDIKNLWTDSLTHVLDRIRPVLVLLGISYDEFDTITDRESLSDWLESNVPQWPVLDILSAARKCQNDQEMGLRTWKVLGDDAQIAVWNEALIALGEGYESIENSLAQKQAEEIIATIIPLFRCLARHIAIDEDSPNLFQDLEKVIRNFKVQPDWSKKWWEVPFTIVMNSLFTKYVTILGSSHPYLKKLMQVTNIDELQNIFQYLGIETECNPYDIARTNKKNLENVMSELYDLYNTWIKIEGKNTDPTKYPDLPEQPNPEAYLNYWTDTELLHQSLNFIGDCKFINACDDCKSLDDIRQRLELDKKKVEKQRKKRIKKARGKKQQKYFLTVAGLNVELGTTNPMDLVQHLLDHSKLTGPDISHDTLTELAFPPTIRPTVINSDKSKSNHNTQSNPEERQFIGCIGEWQAYQFMRKKFGNNVITPDSWVSEIRREFLPPVYGEPDNISDKHGFDFCFTFNSKRWHVEVKSTKGDDTQFDLGVTEIESAVKFANHSPLELWRILRVRNTLSKNPDFDWLPNPFEEEYKDRFRFKENGMRLSYRPINS